MPDAPRPNLVVAGVEAVGRAVVVPVEELGRATRMLVGGFVNVFVPPFRLRLIVQQMEFVGVRSLPIILLTSFFTGAVFTVQGYRFLSMVDVEGLVGGTVGVSLTRELGPSLTALLVAGRAGSAMAAEIGSMRVSEQIDALEAMAVDPINYLVKPRLVATTLVMPLLTAVYDAVGILGSYLVAIYVVGMSPPSYTVRLWDWVDWDDVWTGLVKSVVFGVIIAVVSAYKGFATTGGARGVGEATTSSVVVSSVVILVTNYFLTWALP